jgi:hypothetical protein
MLLPYKEQKVSVTINGERSYGKEVVLLHEHDNLVKNTPWQREGYTVASMFQQLETFFNLVKGLEQLFRESIGKAGIAITPDFPIDQYHQLVQENQPLHLEVMNHTKLFPLSLFPIDPGLLIDRVSELVGVKLKVHNPQTDEQVFHLRIVRPNKTDFNPLHRDTWLDIYRDCVNIYIPVVGSNAMSSLPLVPGSHLWPESEVERTIKGAIMDGAKYNVPGLTNSQHDFTLIRPNPGFNEVLVFSPYLIHGGAANLNTDQTRVSLEMRFWRA